MTGRPTSEALAIARASGAKTYEGSVHARCGTTTRYTKTMGCVQCARGRSSARMDRLTAAAEQINQQQAVDKAMEALIEEEQNPWD